MAFESDADRLAYFVLVGGQYEVAGLDIYGLLSHRDFDTYDIATRMPVLAVRTIDVDHASIGDAVMDGTTEYLIRGIEEDGTGISHLQLELQ